MVYSSRPILTITYRLNRRNQCPQAGHCRGRCRSRGRCHRWGRRRGPGSESVNGARGRGGRRPGMVDRFGRSGCPWSWTWSALGEGDGAAWSGRPGTYRALSLGWVHPGAPDPPTHCPTTTTLSLHNTTDQLLFRLSFWHTVPSTDKYKFTSGKSKYSLTYPYVERNYNHFKPESTMF